MGNNIEPLLFPDKLSSVEKSLGLPEFIVDIARIDWALHKITRINAHFQPDMDILSVNPLLTLLPVSHKNLASILDKEPSEEKKPIIPSENILILIWRHPKNDRLHIREAGDTDLLALKIVIEQIEIRDAAAAGGATMGFIDSVLKKAISQGIILSPKSLIHRGNALSPHGSSKLEEFRSADTFTLQWHITQACDLHCKHCYDRSNRAPLPFHIAVNILDDFYNFCHQMHVEGQVTFTGGNPLLYPDFLNIYRETSNRGFGTAILGNPSPIDQIKELVKIQMPSHFQISLEGLEQHNDMIRGKGHFQRSLYFLSQLRDMGIYTMVMLTLTRDNIDQVLPLADLLRNRADFFTFNRLSTVGEGARLLMAEPGEFQSFLKEYEIESHQNPVLGLKDNLINIVRNQNGLDLFGGCTGYGCGAAFNFVALLADGEVHACRKFPSPIGNILESRLKDIYQSELAHKYRKGSTDCKDCTLNIVCRGCLAIAYSRGLDVFKNKDPFCFRSSVTKKA